MIMLLVMQALLMFTQRVRIRRNLQVHQKNSDASWMSSLLCRTCEGEILVLQQVGSGNARKKQRVEASSISTKVDSDDEVMEELREAHLKKGKDRATASGDRVTTVAFPAPPIDPIP